MAIELSEWIERILYDYMDIMNYRDIIYGMLVDCANYLKANNPIAAGFELYDAAYYLRGLHTYVATYNTGLDPPYMIPYVLKELAEREVDITWKSICEAWVKDDFEGRFWTIGIIDRMRQIMWDEPFDLTWAARPEEREIPSE